MSYENDRMEPVKIKSGRWVCFGHVVKNFGVEAVVMGWHPIAEGLIVKAIDSVGGKWVADPMKCE